MAFRASNTLPSRAYDQAKSLAVQVKRLAESKSSAFASGATSDVVLEVADNLRAFSLDFNTIKQVPGIAEYAAVQEDDPTYDVAVEFTALTTAIAAAIAEIVSTLPQDADDWLLLRKINPDGSLVLRSFSGAQLAVLRSLLDDVAIAVS